VGSTAREGPVARGLGVDADSPMAAWISAAARPARAETGSPACPRSGYALRRGVPAGAASRAGPSSRGMPSQTLPQILEPSDRDSEEATPPPRPEGATGARGRRGRGCEARRSAQPRDDSDGMRGHDSAVTRAPPNLKRSEGGPGTPSISLLARARHARRRRGFMTPAPVAETRMGAESPPVVIPGGY
jgi:hypothetical protein